MSRFHFRLAARAAALVLVLSAVRASADPLIYDPHPNIRVAAAVNKVSTQATYGGVDNRMFLFRRTTSGLEQQVFDGSGWGSWTTRSNANVRGEPADLGSSLVAAGGEFYSTSLAMYLPNFRALFDFIDAAGATQVGRPFWNWLPSAYFWEQAAAPTGGFQPWTAMSWRLGTAQRLNVFGLSDVYSSYYRMVTDTSLREYYFDGTTWRFTDHGKPEPSSYVHLGPGGSVWTNPQGIGDGYVFVTADDLRVWARHYNQQTCPSWCWINLGNPEGVDKLRLPITVTYWWGGHQRVAMFVVGRRYGEWHLYGRYADDNNWATGWGDYGAPPAPAGQLDRGPLKFQMTAGTTFFQNGSLRIALVGTADPVNTLTSGIATHLGGEVVTLLWNGGGWVWQPLRTVGTQSWGPQALTVPVRFQTMSVVSVQDQSMTKVSVFGQDERGTTREMTSSDGATWSFVTH